MHDILQAILNNVALTEIQRNQIIEQFNATQKFQDGGSLGALDTNPIQNWYVQTFYPNGYELNGVQFKYDSANPRREQSTIYYNSPESIIHELTHYTEDFNNSDNWRDSLKSYYDQLNDEKISQLGGDLNFVKRVNNDPGYFYNPIELLARLRSAKYMSQGQQYTPEFFRELRQNETKYGDNMRDLLHMYNDQNLSNLFNARKFQKGGNVQSEEAPDKVKITIGDKSYTVELADTEEELKHGLMNRKSLAEDAGMLFDFNEEGTHEMWMKNTLIPLTQIFLNEDLEVIKVVDREPNDEKLIGCPGTWYVLEVNPGSGIKVGDELDFEDKEDEEYVMKVLAPDGSVQMQLKGGERIVSRKQTKVLIKKAKRAKKAKTNGAYASLGKYMFKVLDGQDNRDPEYVNAPD